MKKFKIGDSVVVKNGVIEPDIEFEIGGWQGRIIEIDKEHDKDNFLITIEWDSITLKQMPEDYVKQSELEGLDWEKMILYESDLEKTSSRDAKKDLEIVKNQLSDKYHWLSFGEEGERISKIIKDIDDEMECYEKWDDYLSENLTFPISAVISDSEGYSNVKIGEKVTIKALSNFVDLYGIIATIKTGLRKYEMPLCDLEVIDEKSKNYQLIKDYKIWFANR